jgi:hypothetical protein
MKQLFIIFTSVLLFWGCGSNDKTTTEKLSAYSTSNVTITSTHSSSNSVELTSSNQTYIEYITTVGMHGEALDIALSDDGNFAYVASGDFGLQVLDISNPQYPSLIGTYDAYGYVNHVEVIGNIVYASYIAQTWDDYERINAYDITYPDDAEYLGYYEGYTSNNHQSVESDGYLYYLSNGSLYTVNKSRNDYQSYALYTPYSLSVCNGYAFVANGRDGITIFKVKGEITSTLVNP